MISAAGRHKLIVAKTLDGCLRCIRIDCLALPRHPVNEKSNVSNDWDE